MSTHEKEAVSVSGIPQGEHGEEGVHYRVGASYQRTFGNVYRKAGTVTRITVTEDLPGPYCNMERVRVYDGETVIFEAPLHNIEGVTYAAPPAAEEAP